MKWDTPKDFDHRITVTYFKQFPVAVVRGEDVGAKIRVIPLRREKWLVAEYTWKMSLQDFLKD